MPFNVHFLLSNMHQSPRKVPVIALTSQHLTQCSPYMLSFYDVKEEKQEGLIGWEDKCRALMGKEEGMGPQCLHWGYLGGGYACVPESCGTAETALPACLETCRPPCLKTR